MHNNLSAAINRLTLILISMLSTGFIAHYNAPKFFNELKHRTVQRYVISDRQPTFLNERYGEERREPCLPPNILLHVIQTKLPDSILWSAVVIWRRLLSFVQ